MSTFQNVINGALFKNDNSGAIVIGRYRSDACAEILKCASKNKDDIFGVFCDDLESAKPITPSNSLFSSPYVQLIFLFAVMLPIGIFGELAMKYYPTSQNANVFMFSAFSSLLVFYAWLSLRTVKLIMDSHCSVCRRMLNVLMNIFFSTDRIKASKMIGVGKSALYVTEWDQSNLSLDVIKIDYDSIDSVQTFYSGEHRETSIIDRRGVQVAHLHREWVNVNDVGLTELLSKHSGIEVEKHFMSKQN